MTVRLSSGLKDALVSNYGLGAMFIGGEFRIYSGAQPETPDAPPVGELVGTITSMNQNLQPLGLRFVLGADVGTVQTDSSLYTVITAILADRPISWFRLVQRGDTGEQSILAPRLDFAVSDAVIADMPESFPELTTYLVSSLKLKFL